MTLKNFVDHSLPVIDAAWLNEVDVLKEALPSATLVTEGDAKVAVKRTETGAVAETQHAFNQYAPLSVDSMGAVPDGTTDSTAAFTSARTASSGRYYLPGPGTYVVDASPDVWADPFFAGPDTFIKIGATTYEVSNSFLGPLRYTSVSNVLYGIVHAITGNTIQLWQNGASGTATYFYRTVAFSTDSHYIQAKPATNGGETDMLIQRSAANADANGNRFNLTFREATDNWAFQCATTASGSPSFDSFMEVTAGTSALLTFPALRPQFNKGFSVKARTSGVLEVALEPTTFTLTKLQQVGGSATVYQSFEDGKQSWFGVAPVVQPASANQAAVTATAGATYTATEQAMLASLKLLVNQLRSDLVSLGLIKGSA